LSSFTGQENNFFIIPYRYFSFYRQNVSYGFAGMAAKRREAKQFIPLTVGATMQPLVSVIGTGI